MPRCKTDLATLHPLHVDMGASSPRRCQQPAHESRACFTHRSRCACRCLRASASWLVKKARHDRFRVASSSVVRTGATVLRSSAVVSHCWASPSRSSLCSCICKPPSAAATAWCSASPCVHSVTPIFSAAQAWCDAIPSCSERAQHFLRCLMACA